MFMFKYVTMDVERWIQCTVQLQVGLCGLLQLPLSQSSFSWADLAHPLLRLRLANSLPLTSCWLRERSHNFSKCNWTELIQFGCFVKLHKDLLASVRTRFQYRAWPLRQNNVVWWLELDSTCTDAANDSVDVWIKTSSAGRKEGLLTLGGLANKLLLSWVGHSFLGSTAKWVLQHVSV